MTFRRSDYGMTWRDGDSLESLTWHDGDSLESSEDPECPETGQVAELHEGGEVAGEDHDEVQPVPGVPQVGVVVQDEALGDHLDHHLHRVDGQEHNSGEGHCMCHKHMPVDQALSVTKNFFIAKHSFHKCASKTSQDCEKLP